MKNFCGKHHFIFEGIRCPHCEKERIDAMFSNFGKYIHKTETRTINNHSKETVKRCVSEPGLDWDDLTDKFNIKH